ncbi:helix-turn-helix transcriptional regulator [Bacillus carboniphilus]|uniref:Helix-turn-helix transcriptional regulator n=1 Tax=Bacillus carboniphilus TaxID=86663 RepID=A0ABP3FDK7_9BACI
MTAAELQKFLIKKREQMNLTHQNVADLSKAGISRQYYGMIESGERKPSVKVAKKIAQVLNVEWTIFFDTESNQKLQSKTTA